jgi:hypothetical protein
MSPETYECLDELAEQFRAERQMTGHRRHFLRHKTRELMQNLVWAGKAHPRRERTAPKLLAYAKRYVDLFAEDLQHLGGNRALNRIEADLYAWLVAQPRFRAMVRPEVHRVD